MARDLLVITGRFGVFRVVVGSVGGVPISESCLDVEGYLFHSFVYIYSLLKMVRT